MDEKNQETEEHAFMTQEEMRQYASMQIQEIDRYKWCMGVRLGHDPLKDRELNSIVHEWIQNYAAGFRAEYQNQRLLHRKKNSSGSMMPTAA